MGGMSAEMATGGPASRGSYPMLPMDDLDVLAAELQPRSMARPAERRLMRTMPGEDPLHFADVPWVAPLPKFGAAEPVPASVRLAREAGDHLSGLASGVSDNLAEWRRRKDVAEYQALPGWQQPLVATTDMADIFVDGATLGFGNKVAAALGTLTSDDSYDELLAKNRAVTQGAYNRAGLAGTALGLVGGVRSGKSLVDAGLGLSRWAPKAVQGAPKPDLLKRLGDFGKKSAAAAADGAIVGVLDAIGHDTDVGTGLATGGGLGFVMPGAFKTVGAAISPLVKKLASSPAVQRMVIDPLAASRSLRGVETQARRKVGHDAVEVPQRPFEADYPRAPEYDEKTGRLLSDIEGRPLRAEHIAGRRTIGGADVALTPEELLAAGEGMRVTYKKVDRKVIEGNPGRVRVWYNPETKTYEEATVWTDKKLRADARARVQAHETGHILDHIVDKIPIDGIEDELRFVYSTLRHGPELTARRGPEHDGYAGVQVRDELIAEALRAYIRHPNWFKTHAPNAAKRIRHYVNSDSTISPYIQFNTLMGTVGVGVGAGSILDEDDEAAARRASPNEL